MDLVYMGCKKRQDLFSKLGACESQVKVEGEKGRREGNKEKYKVQ